MGYTRVRFIDDGAETRSELYGREIAAPPSAGTRVEKSLDAPRGARTHACRVETLLDARLAAGAPDPCENSVEFIIAIGDNQARSRCYARALQQGWTPATLIHPSATVSPHSEISPGCVVLPRAVVNAGAVVGQNSIINTGAVVEHDCRLSSHVHISPAATLGGAVHVDAFAHVGIGACVLPGCRIGAGSIVGAGAVILTSIPEAVTAAGVPARILSRSKAGAR